MNEDEKIPLEYMVTPEDLTRRCFVPNAVRIRIVEPESEHLKGLLGESGRKMANGGCVFLFNAHTANYLILQGVAERAE